MAHWDQQQALASLLAQLRRDGRQQSGLDATLTPPDASSAYQVATLVEKSLGWEVIGWKIAATNDTMQQALRSDSPIYGRVFAPNVFESPHVMAHAGLCSPIPEVEYQIFLNKDLPARDAPYKQAEVIDAIASIHPGIELAECRFIHDEHFPPLPAILADASGSGTLVYGPAIKNWQQRDIATQEVVLFCNGNERRTGNAQTAMEHPVAPLTWLANELSRTGVGMRAGQIISTGTMTGMLKPKAGETFVADFGEFGQVSIELT
jgi:2-oxo-hept-3-ene-1,7-dioate hydratase